MNSRPPITAKSDAARLVRRAQLRASLLRQAGFHKLNQSEREKIADDLDDLSGLVVRAFDPIARHDVSVIPRALVDDDEPCEFDLMGGAA